MERKLGLLEPAANFVKATRTWETDNKPLWTDAQIRDVIQDKKRTTSRELFDSHWIKEGDQQDKGSCNGWATASVLSKTRWKQGVRDGIVLSGSYVYSWINGGQDNGSPLDQDIKELTTHGTCPKSMCGPQMIFRNQTKQFDVEAAKYKGLNFLPIDTIQGLKTAVAMGFLVVVAVQVGPHFNKLNSQGILTPDSGNGNHAVHVDDMIVINDKIYFDLVNNWNVTWGQDGRAYVPEEMFTRTIQVHQFWALMSNLEALS